MTTTTTRVDEAVRRDVDRSAGERRSIETRWTIPSTAQVDRYDETNTAALEISVHHSKDHKGYIMSVHRVIVGPNFVRWAMELRDQDPCPVPAYVLIERTGRYSAKRLQELHAEHILRIAGSMSENLEPLLEWATRAQR